MDILCVGALAGKNSLESVNYYNMIALLQNALLHETSEEWEQCEKKMKEVRSWIDKARTSLESAPNKKRPIRDQVLLREKMVPDIATQKSKLSISVEKLQVTT